MALALRPFINSLCWFIQHCLSALGWLVSPVPACKPAHWTSAGAIPGLVEMVEPLEHFPGIFAVQGSGHSCRCDGLADPLDSLPLVNRNGWLTWVWFLARTIVRLCAVAVVCLIHRTSYRQAAVSGWLLLSSQWKTCPDLALVQCRPQVLEADIQRSALPCDCQCWPVEGKTPQIAD